MYQLVTALVSYLCLLQILSSAALEQDKIILCETGNSLEHLDSLGHLHVSTRGPQIARAVSPILGGPYN